MPVETIHKVRTYLEEAATRMWEFRRYRRAPEVAPSNALPDWIKAMAAEEDRGR